jgi:hypothetical protein
MYTLKWGRIGLGLDKNSIYFSLIYKMIKKIMKGPLGQGPLPGLGTTQGLAAAVELS